MNWIETLTDAFAWVQQWLFESWLEPLMFALGLAQYLEQGYAAMAWLLVGILQIMVLLAVIGPLERWRPVEQIKDRKAVRTDVIYTLAHRLGLFRIGLFFTVTPLFDALFSHLRVAGVGTAHLDALWPGVTDIPWVTLLMYMVALDFVNYWVHRAQHQWEPWWALHALHHSQRQLTMWSDNRNHLLDDLIHSSVLVLVAQLIGVEPGQFVLIVALTQLSESLQHANIRLWFGPVGERLWISPRFHRLHHAVGIGHEWPVLSGQSHPSTLLGGANFGVLLPWWDMLFGTASFEKRWEPTGIRDQVQAGADGSVRDYGSGFWSQQWLGLCRLCSACRHHALRRRANIGKLD